MNKASIFCLATSLLLQSSNYNITARGMRQDPASQPITLQVAPKATIQKPPVTEWCNINIMAARNNLAPFASRNLQDIALAGENDKVVTVAQWDQPGKKGAWRYVVKNKEVKLDHYTPVANPGNVKQNVIDFVTWAVNNYPAKKYCINMWNHGTGAIDPNYSDPLRFFMNNRASLLETPSISVDEFIAQCACEQLEESRLKAEMGDSPDRGILFDDDHKTYLNNADLKKVLAQITQIIGQKIDVLGFDACFMASSEIAYQARDYAKFMVSSEELELAKGWNYPYIFSELNKRHTKTPAEVAKDIVTGFEKHYKGRTQLYTQSAINLSKINNVKDCHKEIIASMKDCLKLHGRRMLNSIGKARRGCLQFTAKIYVDLHSLYKNLIQKTLAEEGIAPTVGLQKDRNLLNYDSNTLLVKGYDKTIVNFVSKLKEGMKAIQQTVIANTCSQHLSEAKGLSIYFPTTKHLDPSYNNNEFAQDSNWQSFLDTICQTLH